MHKDIEIAIVGGGPVGSLLSIYLSDKGYQVEVFEKREDPRASHKSEGRSINLALSHRGLRALEEAGLKDIILNEAVPMKGRMIHDAKGNLNFQAYGAEGQMIYSVSRNRLNELIIDKAEKDGSVKFHFDNICKEVNPENGTVKFLKNDNNYSVKAKVIFGADGAFSAVRRSFAQFENFSFDQKTLSHGYKELHIPAGPNAKHLMEKNALHIWPREQFMLIALPNNDGSFTATLFLPVSGPNSFEEIKTEEQLLSFFENKFPDVLPLIPDLLSSYFAHPPSSLVTMHCYPWSFHETMIIGDAAHAITPFYGQGMNAGFEDCRILKGMLDKKEIQWNEIFNAFQKERKKNADAIAELALQNFIEMRDLVGDAQFLLRKKIEARVHQVYPDYLPLYTMVTFSDIPYDEALNKGKDHDRMMEKVMAIKDLESNWQTEGGWQKIEAIIQPLIKK